MRVIAAILLVAASLVCASEMFESAGNEHFVHGAVPSAAVTATLDASREHVWAAFVEEGATEEVEADVPVPAELADEEDAETEAETYALIESPEPVTFESSAADSEELTTESSDVAPVVTATLDAEAEQIMANMDAQAEHDAEVMHAWDANAEGTMTDSEESEIADAEVVAEATANAAAADGPATATAAAPAPRPKCTGVCQDKTKECTGGSYTLGSCPGGATIQCCTPTVPKSTFLQLAEAEEGAEDEVEGDMSESPALVEEEAEAEEESEDESEEESEEEAEEETEEESEEESEDESEAEEESEAEDESESEEEAEDESEEEEEEVETDASESPAL